MGGSASWGDGWRREFAGWAVCASLLDGWFAGWEAARVNVMGGSASFGDGWRLEFAGWAAARVCGMGGGASLLESDLVLFVCGLNGLGRCGWGSGHLVYDLRAGRLVGVVQVGSFIGN